MNTQPIEARVRDALDAHAESFSASPDAWQRVLQKNDVPSTSRRGMRTGWPARHSAFVIPAAAAAVVLAVALGAVALTHGLTSATPPAVTPSAATPTPELPIPSWLLTEYAPASPLRTLGDAPQVTTTFWIGAVNPLYWLTRLVTGPQACHVTSDPDGLAGTCWTLPATSAATPAVVLGADRPLTQQNKQTRRSTTEGPVLVGVAEPAAASVMAMLPDGQRVHGKVAAIGGVPVKVWTVTGSLPKGTKLVFAASSGQVLARIDATTPQGPAVIHLARPAHGGVPLFHYPASGPFRPGIISGYLVDGHVAFFGSGKQEAIPYGGAVSPQAAAAAPAIGGIVLPFRLVCSQVCHEMSIKAFGYAHGDVAKVVIRLPGGSQVAADTFRAGWPGSDLRLWQVTVPDSEWPADGTLAGLPVTAYDATGHVIGHAQLGHTAE